MKSETLAYNRVVVYYHKDIGANMRRYVQIREKRAHQHAPQNVRAYIFALCAHVFSQDFMKMVLVVHYCFITFSLKFHKDQSFC